MATPDFSVQLLRHLLRYDPETGLLYRRSGPRSGSPSGSVSNGYLYVSLFKKHYRAHRLAWAISYGEWPLAGIDHINGDKLDNRLSNLREADAAANNQNLRRPRSTSKSGLIGAFLDAATGRYRSTIRVDGKNHDLGRFATADDAHAAYVEAKRRLHKSCTL